MLVKLFFLFKKCGSMLGKLFFLFKKCGSMLGKLVSLFKRLGSLFKRFGSTLCNRGMLGWAVLGQGLESGIPSSRLGSKLGK